MKRVETKTWARLRCKSVERGENQGYKNMKYLDRVERE